MRISALAAGISAVIIAAAVLPNGPVGAAVRGTSAAAPTCGGVKLVKNDGSAWTCTFTDEFSGTTLDATKWTPQVTASSGFHSGSECFVNSPNNLSVSGGTLQLTVRKEASSFYCKQPLPNLGYGTSYTSGAVTSIAKFTQAYGRFDIRAKFPAATVQGLQSSLWLWPQNSVKYGPIWPMSGEIDIAEEYSKYPDRVIPTAHYLVDPLSINAKNNTNTYTNYQCLVSNVAAFHDYVVEWTPNTLKFVYDGSTCLVDNYRALLQSGARPFDQPFMMAMTQALGIGDNSPNANTPLPATTEIDYVRVWK
ncbi:MAG: hypothetical protein QOE97_1588 [Pseudonocardiales bacterium]|jgi:beta-glucanase (GH16 family)|nr:hypothetical protein [Pseudonocardiales bacterium]